MIKKVVTHWVLCGGLLLANQASCLPNSIRQTQNKMKQVDVQINQLKHTLSKAQDKHSLLDKELATTETQIGKGVNQLRLIQGNVDSTQVKITQLTTQVSQLDKQLNQQRQLVSQHMRALYQMGEYQPMKSLINQNSPQELSRILTYYQYLLKSREQVIDAMKESSTALNQSRTSLREEWNKQSLLKKELSQHQEKLLQQKNYHAALIQKLNQDIHSQQRHLEDAQKNKAALAALLKTLSQQSVVKPSRPFAQMRKKLPYPIRLGRRSLKNMNQGVTFFADEGTSVAAVYPGKVVFSDWLKGYGLLLIIDHGRGFMTLYAHNQSLFKRKGQFVNQNETIAKVGHTGGIRQNGLYFEVRVRGKAVPPLGWLQSGI